MKHFKKFLLWSKARFLPTIPIPHSPFSLFLSPFSLLLVPFSLNAQVFQISVVSPDDETTLFTDLNLAIQDAQPGSIVYIPGGIFQIHDSTKINKKLTIIGIGHRTDNDNADGYTQVIGNLCFEIGSDNSSVIGLYLSGSVNIGKTDEDITYFLLRYCNVNSVQIGSKYCQHVLINQNYIRGTCNGGDSPVYFMNNILHSISHINNGVIANNLIANAGNAGLIYCTGTVTLYASLNYINFTRIENNFFLVNTSPCNYYILYNTSNSFFYNNAACESLGENCIVVSNFNDVFIGPFNSISITSNFHLKDGPWKTGAIDGGEIGIYGGGGFGDSQLPPIPRITHKRIAEQTDEEGKLKIQIQVKAQ